ncbi:prolipoprotein diacylglyceryl transferase [Cellulomonas denverensis]|uniref:Phosphatidylglycerol--prolipoprotein diacylglyceryl transferase n=1 Tax=Cellulomonas denverensis TaxID=264297 RepID=A0A7X6KT45_9CELL|nr:prolipoprotein diacylglyceryl transferase [Cellulomonas denverensis]NKY21811.1 prolipoprotein diacylglyceryl transferase [Cellulomonas denverensis]GIG24300.1 prolipoprotein diacylglyceryl transferase 2 [Cellulomonas denverensis]
MIPAALLPASIPSPPNSVWYLGPLPLRAYALAILAGIVVAAVLTQRRWKDRGGDPDEVLEIAFWAVPFGIVGGRLYHVITSPDAYFGAGGDPWKAFAIWEGGLGIWGAVALGAVGAYIGCRRLGVSFPVFADALAPGLLIAQAIGRLGNWFNQELFGGPTTLPWGLEIDAAHLPAGFEAGTLFHPTFLYEMLWNLAGAALLIWLDRRFRLGHGRVFWLYVLIYTSGRLWIELVRIDEAHTIAGLRVNVWMSIIVGLGALVAFLVVGRRHPGRETSTRAGSSTPQDAPDATPVPAQDTGTPVDEADEAPADSENASAAEQ